MSMLGGNDQNEGSERQVERRVGVDRRSAPAAQTDRQLVATLRRALTEFGEMRGVVAEAGEAYGKAARLHRLTRVAAVIAVIAVIIGGVLWWDSREQDRALRRETDARALEQQQARVSSCGRFNEGQQRLRDAVREDALDLIEASGIDPNNSKAKEFVELKSATARASFPFRDCTPGGIERYLSKPPASVDCKPLDTGMCAP